jgi:nitroimidazol reductase NimA-like FMN-containing flavoprotein (pyridoxamine 5'-phosphate oxidase superfamily)
MRRNPKVCVQTDEIQNQGEWISVVVYGEYEELPSRNTEPSVSLPVRCRRNSITGGLIHWVSGK